MNRTLGHIAVSTTPYKASILGIDMALRRWLKRRTQAQYEAGVQMFLPFNGQQDASDKRDAA